MIYIFVFLVISTERCTGTTIEQGTQQAVPCDTHCDSNQYPLITVLCVLAQLMIFVHTQHACYILVQWKWKCFLSLYYIIPGSTKLMWNHFTELKYILPSCNLLLKLSTVGWILWSNSEVNTFTHISRICPSLLSVSSGHFCLSRYLLIVRPSCTV